MGIDELVRELSDALAAQGMPRPSPAEDVAVLDEIETAIAPLRLPREIRRFWELVDPESIQAALGPRFSSPDFALDSWNMHWRQFDDMTPRSLFPVAYESHVFTFVELHSSGSDDGGRMFYWMYGGCPFFTSDPSLGALLETMIQMIRGSHFERIVGYWEHGDQLILEERSTSGFDSIPEEPAEWPDSWLRHSAFAD